MGKELVLKPGHSGILAMPSTVKVSPRVFAALHAIRQEERRPSISNVIDFLLHKGIEKFLSEHPEWEKAVKAYEVAKEEGGQTNAG